MSRGEKKNIEQWWHKYEAMGRQTETMERPETFYSCLNSVHGHWVSSGQTSVLIQADIKHHISLQKVFAKWREVYGKGI